MVTLQSKQVEKNLTGLARSPDNLSHVFTDLALPEKGIESIEVIEDFPHIQNLDLKGNKISELKPLAKLPHLLTLNASRNNVHAVLDFEQPHCTPGNAWTTGDKNVGSTLQEADLSSNIICEIRDLSAHRFLRKLILDNNQISVISGIDSLRHLKVLSLKNNQIETISGLGSLPLQSLHLDSNKLTRLKNLDNLPRLRHLTLGDNGISSMGALKNCFKLDSVDLSNNQIGAIRQAEFLQELPLLCKLVLTGNPVQKKEYYRRRILVRLQRLTSLDNTIVSAEEKAKSLNLHGEDIEHRTEVFDKYLPDDEDGFVNYSPPFQEPEGEPEDERLSPKEEEEVVKGVIENAAENLVSDMLADSMTSIIG